MQILICLREEKATSTHFVKVYRARDSPKGRIDMPPPQMRISKTLCDVHFFDYPALEGTYEIVKTEFLLKSQHQQDTVGCSRKMYFCILAVS